jgi:hypothetical protein
MKIFALNQFLFKSSFKKFSLFPFYYFIFLLLIKIIFPWEILNGKTAYQLWGGCELIAEFFQNIFYISASGLALYNIFKNKYRIFSLQNLFWTIYFVFCLVIFFEEISFLNNFQGNFFEQIREINNQNEINFHNLLVFQPYLFHVNFVLNLFFGFVGWRFLRKIDAFPSRFYSFFFLFSALNAFLNILNIPTTSEETFEFLTSLGLFLHALEMKENYTKIIEKNYSK